MVGFFFLSVSGLGLLFFGILTPYSKKEPEDCFTPRIGILYFSVKYCVSNI